MQPAGCTKQLIEVEAVRSFTGTRRLQTFGLRLRKSCVPRAGYSKRRAHAPRSVAEFLVGSTRGQPRGKVFKFHSNMVKAEPDRGPIQAARSGWATWRTGASRDQSPQRCVACSTLGGARPRLPQFGRQAPRHGRQVDHGAGMVCSPMASHGTGRPSRRHKSKTAACRGCLVTAAHRSRALPPAPQQKQLNGL